MEEKGLFTGKTIITRILEEFSYNSFSFDSLKYVCNSFCLCVENRTEDFDFYRWFYDSFSYK